ncbi:MAG: IS5 family transposase, partial [Thermoguttaceae bacterium]
ALKKNGPQAIGISRGGRNTKIHLIVADERTPIVFQLSPGQAADDPEGCVLIPKLPEYYKTNNISLLMDKAYEGDRVRALVVSQGLVPVVPPKSNRVEPWEYDRELYKRRNEVERYFRRLKGFRRVFTRYDKLDVMYSSFVVFAMICETLRE